MGSAPVAQNASMNNEVGRGKAKTVKTTFYRETSISIDIKADAAIVWALLTRASDYSRWNSTVTSLEGKIALGETIKLKSTLDAKRVFKLKVKEFDPEKRLVWGDGQGNRVYTISKNGHLNDAPPTEVSGREVGQGNGTVTFSMTEKIGGLMFPLYAKMIPSFDQSFEQFANDLRKESEAVMMAK